ncbi:hypothetical protein DVH24_039651 [Malus domestica]|uniref:Uncharacterized protein n=1 Tax=Malus domestica TaxID=3750 RepID=A0A498I3B8_MALDO|nr:hypothetical protein DVH24_039651 [Malus domestica]
MAKLPSISSWFPVLFSYRCSEMAFLPMLGTGPSSYFFSLQLGFFFPLPFCWLFSLADLCFDPSYFAFCSSKSLRSSQILCTLFHKIFTKLASKVLSFVVKSCVPSFCFLGILFAVSVFKEVVHPCERFILNLQSLGDFVSLFASVIPVLSPDFRRIFSPVWERPVFSFKTRSIARALLLVIFLYEPSTK